MNNTNFDFVNYDFESAVLERKTAEIQSYLDKLLDFLVKSFQKKQVFELQKRVDIHKKKVHYCARKEIKSENISFAIGRYYGILEAISGCVDDQVRKERALNEITVLDFEKIPHINDVVAIIASDPGIRHGELAKKVGIERNTLTSITDRLVEYDIITFSRPGKFKYYYLTELGKNYYEENLVHIQEDMNIDFLIEQLLLVMSKSTTPDELAAKVVQSIIAGKHKFKGFESNHSEEIDMLQFIPDIIANNPTYVITSNLTEAVYVDTAQIISLDPQITPERWIYFGSLSELSENNIFCENEVTANE